MGRPETVVYIATSLDGFIARPDGAIDWLESTEPQVEGEDYGWAEFIASVDGIVMGRATFDQLLGFDQWIYGELPMTVLTTTRKQVPEHLRATVRLSDLEPAALLRDLGERGHRRLYVDGGKTIQSFLREGLIDELVITRLPVLIGQGIPLFGPLDGDIGWQHLRTQVYDNGLVKSSYRRRSLPDAPTR